MTRPPATRPAPPPAPSPRPPGTCTAEVLRRFREPAHVVQDPDGRRRAVLHPDGTGEVLATLPGIHPEWLGDRSFTDAHATRFPYVGGEMANGIASTAFVTALARAGALAFFGAAGLPPDQVRRAVDVLHRDLAGRAGWGVNLIHAPQDPRGQRVAADLLIDTGVPAVSLSAFLDADLDVVRLAAAGAVRDTRGTVHRPRRLLAKVSHPEVARVFAAPAPRPLLDRLVATGALTAEEADAAATVPLVEDVTVEADSGGHTDNRPLTAVFPAVAAAVAAARAEHGHHVRCGAAGGLGTPQALAAAFALGAAYVLTGSVNQSCVQAGTSAAVKEALARADVADAVMAPAPDTFESGSRVQVLRRGSLFAPRANQLHALYRAHASLEDIPAPRRRQLEETVFGDTLERTWERTRQYWAERGPHELERAAADPRHRMALVFRWYLGRSSWWAVHGDPDRRTDYQVWSGPALGAFNAWARGSFLEDPRGRDVAQVAWNLLEGAAVATRAQQVRSCGVPVHPDDAVFTPRPLAGEER